MAAKANTMTAKISYIKIAALFFIGSGLDCFCGEVKTLEIREGGAFVLWSQLLGMNTGSVSLTRDAVFVGSDNLESRLRHKGENYSSAISSFNKENGVSLWQMEVGEIPAGLREAYNPIRGIAVDIDRAYFTTSRSESSAWNLPAHLRHLASENRSRNPRLFGGPILPRHLV